jgi:hypothetical protein
MTVSPAMQADPVMVMTIEAEAVEQAIRPLLAGRQAGVQGGALACLLATFISGHQILGDREQTAALREEILSLHIKAVRQLVEIMNRDHEKEGDSHG